MVHAQTDDGLIFKYDPLSAMITWSLKSALNETHDALYSTIENQEGDFISTGVYALRNHENDIFINKVTFDGVSCCMNHYDMQIAEGGVPLTGVTYVPHVMKKNPHGIEDFYYAQVTICQGQESRMASVYTESGKYLAVTIEPNPLQNEAIIRIKSDSPLINSRIYIYDVVGKQITSLDASSQEISLSAELMKSGMYFFTIESRGKTVYAGKFVVEKIE
jgi:hypothetical protein